MKKLNGAEPTKIETSCIHSQIACRVLNVFSSAESEVEFNHDDIIKIMGTCLKELTGCHGVLFTPSNPDGQFIKHGEGIHYYEHGVHTGRFVFMPETTESKKNDVELKQCEAIPSSALQPEPSLGSLLIYVNKYLAKENNSDKYAAKYLAKETHANDLDPEEQARNADEIHSTKGRALSLLIDNKQISNNTEIAQHVLELKIAFVKSLFSGLLVNDPHLEAKLAALMNAVHQFKGNFRGYIFNENRNRELDKAKELAHSIRENIHYAFSYLN